VWCFKTRPNANLQTVIGHSMATVQLSNFGADNQPFDKFRQSRLAIPSQNKKRGKATHEPTQFASHFILPNRTNTDFNFYL